MEFFAKSLFEGLSYGEPVRKSHVGSLFGKLGDTL